MPIDPSVAIGAELPPSEFSWTSSDIQLYHLALGAGADPMNPRELSYLVDNTPQVLPTFGNVAQSFHLTEPPTVPFPGYRHRARQDPARSGVGDGGGPDPAVGQRASDQPCRRHLGQGQGRGDSRRSRR